MRNKTRKCHQVETKYNRTTPLACHTDHQEFCRRTQKPKTFGSFPLFLGVISMASSIIKSNGFDCCILYCLFFPVWSLAFNLRIIPNKMCILKTFNSLFLFFSFIFSHSAAKHCRCGTNTIDWDRNLSVPLHGLVWKFVQFGMYYFDFWLSFSVWIQQNNRNKTETVEIKSKAARNESEIIWLKVFLAQSISRKTV